jgi:hypothetical protein
MKTTFDPAARAKRVLRSLLGEQIIGMIDYIRSPDRGAAWGGPFNGQPVRQALFREIIATMRPQGIVETGTYLGTTTDANGFAYFYRRDRSPKLRLRACAVRLG